ncbi:MAG: hypothetical protein V3T78_04460 [Dehalococcoidia bacterium]
MLEKSFEVGPAVARNDLLCCDRFDVMDRVHEIPLSSLVICGTEDVMTPVKYANYLAERIPRSQRCWWRVEPTTSTWSTQGW